MPKPESFEGSLHVFEGLGIAVVLDFNGDVELIGRDGGSLEWNTTEKKRCQAENNALRVDCTYLPSNIWSWTSPKTKKIVVSASPLLMVSWLSCDMITVTILSHVKYGGHELASWLADISAL